MNRTALSLFCVPSHAMSSRRGAIVIMFLFALPVLLILAGLAVNIAHIQFVRTELQIVNDAAARAATRTYAATGSLSSAQAAAQSMANVNSVNSQVLTVRTQDLELGLAQRNSETERYSFTPGNSFANAIRVRLNRDNNSPEGPVRLMFPNIAGSGFAEISGGAVATQVELDLVLVIDRSGSMAFAADEAASGYALPAAALPGWLFNGPVPNPSRWLDTYGGVMAFLAEMQASPQQERVSLVTYSHFTTRDAELTTNYTQIADALNFYSNFFASGSTDIGGGIMAATQELTSGATQRPWASKAIVVLTDGIHNTGTDPIDAAQAAAGDGVMIFTVTFAQEADQSRMQEVAAIGGGTHFHATNSAQLIQVFREIAGRMPTLLSR